MYILFPLTFVAIAWSFYDVFHVIFKTRGIFEEGVPHMVPASMLVGPYFRRDALGPYPPPPPPPPTWFQRLFTAWMEVPIEAGKTASKTIQIGRDYTLGPLHAGIQASQSIVKGVGSAVEGVGDATKALTSGVANVVVGEVKDKVHEAGEVASSAIQKAKVATDAVAGTVAEGAKAAEGTAALLQKIPAIGEKVASEMADPSKIIDAAKKSTPQVPQVPQVPQLPSIAQAGGALLLDAPSVSTSVLLFSMALVAFSGYVFYTMRNTYKKPEKSDDPPRDPGTVRGPAKSSE